MKEHNWKPETMNRCRKIFFDELLFAYYNFVDSKYRKNRIEKLIVQFGKIQKDVKNMVQPNKQSSNRIPLDCEHSWRYMYTSKRASPPIIHNPKHYFHCTKCLKTKEVEL